MRSLADDLIAAGQLAPADREGLVERIHEAARRGQFFMRLTMYAVVASAPAL